MWDDDKSTAGDPDNPAPDEQVTADEWDAMVADQKGHSVRHESGGADELDVSGLSGVLTDAQTPQSEAVEDIVGALIAGGTNVTTTYDDGAGTLTIDATGVNEEEEVEDIVGALVTGGGVISVNYDDANDTLTISVDESALSFYDGTNLTAPVDNNSVTTEDAFNSSIGDSVDYLDPLWYGRSQALIYPYIVMSADATLTNTSGSGSTNVSQPGLILVTGTTSGSHARIQQDRTLSREQTFDKDRSIRIGVDFETTGGELYVGVGSPLESDKTRQHLAVAMDGSDLIGSVGDNSTQTTTTLASGAATGGRSVRIEFEAGSRAEFFVGGTKQGEITSGLPSGTTHATFPFTAFVANSTATNRRMEVGEISWVQAP